MNKQKLQKTLENLGLSRNEAMVYLAALSLGPTSVKQIAAISGVKRTSVYNIVDSLEQYGLLHVEVAGLKHLYVAENPEALSSMLERRKVDLNEALPSLMETYDKKAGQNAITYIQGMTAVRNMYKKMPQGLKRGDPYFIITNSEEWYQLDTEFADKFIENRAKLGLDLKMLTQRSEVAERFKKYEKNFGMKIKFLPESASLNTNMAVTNDRVLIQQLTFPIMAVIIENRSIIEMHQQLFQIMWDAIPE